MLDPTSYLATSSQGRGGVDTPLYSYIATETDCSTSFGHNLTYSSFKWWL